MKRYVLTPAAERDLNQIWNHIVDDDVDAAGKVSSALRTAMRKLAEMPGMGHRRSDVQNPRYRFWVVFSYVIAYLPDTEPLVIARVVHGRRDFTRLFRR